MQAAAAVHQPGDPGRGPAEGGQHLGRIGGLPVLGHGEVGHHPRNPQPGQGARDPGQVHEPGRQGALATHARVHLEVDGQFHPLGDGRAREFRQDGRIDHHRGQPMFDDPGRGLWNHPGEHEDGQVAAGPAQGLALHRLGHAKGSGAAGGEQTGAFDHAVTVAVGLDHGHDRGLARLLPAESEVVRQGGTTDCHTVKRFHRFSKGCASAASRPGWTDRGSSRRPDKGCR